MKLQSWVLLWTGFLATFRLIGGDVLPTTAADDDDVSDDKSGIRISPRGERRMRMKKRPAVGRNNNDTSAVKNVNDVVVADVNVNVNDDSIGDSSAANRLGTLEKPPNFLQLIPFRLDSGTPMLRWRPGRTRVK